MIRPLPVAACAPVTLLLLLAAGCGSDPATTTPLARYAVERGDLTVLVIASGTMKPDKPVVIAAKVEGRIISVAENRKAVKKGDLLLDLENRSLAAGAEQARLDLETAERALANAEADLRLHELETANKTEEAERTLRFARMKLEQYVEGKAPLQERDLVLALERATAEDQTAREKHARMPDLLAKGFVTPAEARSAELEANEKKAAVDKKKRELEIFRRYDLPQERARLEADVATAVLGIERTKQQLSTLRGQKMGAIEREKGNLERNRAKLADGLEQLTYLRVVAPSDGVVVYEDNYQDRRSIEPGADVAKNLPFLTVSNVDAQVAHLEVPEMSIGKIDVGQAVTVVIESQNRRYRGSVLRIDESPINDWRSDVKRYPVIVQLRDADGVKFRPGMSIRGEIAVDAVANCLSIPVNAVTARGRETFVNVERPGQAPETRAIKLGVSNGIRVEVRSGLTESDVVVVTVTDAGRVAGAATGAAAAGGTGETGNAGGKRRPPGP